MKFFEDKAMENRIFDLIDFGIVPVGETKQVNLWVLNDDSPKVTGNLKDLTFRVSCLDPETEKVIEDEEVDVLEAPEIMHKQEIAPLVLSWTPNVTLEQGLKAKLTISGQKVIG